MATEINPIKLGRAIPRPSACSRFNPAAVLVFTSVMHGGVIQVPAIDNDAGALIVQNCMQKEHARSHEHFSVKFCSTELVGFQVKQYPDHLREGHPEIMSLDISSSPEHLLRYINTKKIAMTPREHFLEVEHSESSAKPFSLRQRHSTNGPLTDYEQAAHDARRMGWLLHVPSTIGNGVNDLVLPTRWHGEYLQHLLTPKSVSHEAQSCDLLDSFLVIVIERFRSSVLRACHAVHHSLHEKVVDAEFMHGAEEVAGDPCFVLPQVQTAGRPNGIIDFIVPTKNWLIELLVEGNDVPGHIRRFDSDQPYGKQWPNWDWRVIDFRYEKRPEKRCKSHIPSKIIG